MLQSRTAGHISACYKVAQVLMACPYQHLLQSRTVQLCSKRWCGQPCEFVACDFVARYNTKSHYATLCQQSRTMRLCSKHPCGRCATKSHVGFFFMRLLPTASVREVMQDDEINSAHLSICSHSIFANDWPLTLSFCMWVGHDHSSQWIEGQSQCSR